MGGGTRRPPGKSPQLPLDPPAPLSGRVLGEGGRRLGGRMRGEGRGMGGEEGEGRGRGQGGTSRDVHSAVVPASEAGVH